MMGPFDVMALVKDDALLKYVVQRTPTYQIHTDEHELIFESWNLWEGKGKTIELHKFYRADKPGCFHSHPARAMRMIIRGGYVEEVYHPRMEKRHEVDWNKGEYGMVEPNFTHRIDRLIGDEPAVSIWWRERRMFPVHLRGEGWGHREGERLGEHKIDA